MDYINAAIILVPSAASVGWIIWQFVGVVRGFCKLKQDRS